MRIAILVLTLLGTQGCAKIVLHGVEDGLARGLGNAIAKGPGLGVHRGNSSSGASEAFQSQLLAIANTKRQIAADAARVNDCARVYAMEQEIRLLPWIRIEGGYLTTVFLRDPEIARCVTEHRACIAEGRPECLPPAPQSRSECLPMRRAHFESSFGQSVEARLAVLAAIPRCPGTPADQDHEQVWLWTLNATSTALRGDCTFALELDPRVASQDRDHHAQVWSKDPAIAKCHADLAAYRVDRERCLRERGVGLRRAQTISNAKQRGEALAAIRKCPEPR